MPTLVGMAKRLVAVLLVLAGCLGPLAGRSAPPDVTRLAQSQLTGPIALGAGQKRIALTPMVQALAQSVANATEVYLVLAGLQADAPPGVVFNIYLALPPGAAPGPDSPFIAGTLNFFAARSHPTVSLDVTAVAHKLASRGLLDAGVDVVVASTVPPAPGSHPAVTSITLIAQ